MHSLHSAPTEAKAKGAFVCAGLDSILNALAENRPRGSSTTKKRLHSSKPRSLKADLENQRALLSVAASHKNSHFLMWEHYGRTQGFLNWQSLVWQHAETSQNLIMWTCRFHKNLLIPQSWGINLFLAYTDFQLSGYFVSNFVKV